MDKRILSLIIIAVLIISFPITLNISFAKEGMITFQISLFDNQSFTEYSGFSIPPSLLLYGQVFAINPPSDKNTLEEIFRGEIKGGMLILTSSGKLGKISQEWIEFQKSRNTLDERSEFGLQLNVWIISRINHQVLQRISYYYTYSPVDFLQGKSYSYNVRAVVFGLNKIADINYDNKRFNEASATENSKIKKDAICPGPYSVWEISYVLKPENYTSAYGNDITFTNGAYYIKLPVLTIYNDAYASGMMGGAISIDIVKQTWFYVTTGMGFEIEKKLKSGDISGGFSGSLFLGGQSFKEYVSFFRQVYNIGAYQWAYIWIWARPIIIFYKEVLYDSCTGQRLGYSGYEKIDSFIQDVIKYSIGQNQWVISGDSSYNKPPAYFFDWISNPSYSSEKYLFALNPNEGRSLGSIIYGLVDTCETDFELPIAVGASLAAVAITTGFGWLAPFIAMISVSISWGESASVFIGGGIQNSGPYIEYEYIRISNLQFKKNPPWWCFWCGTCYYDIPVSFYFRSL
ncbi:MAG TPA: hypothetical protein VKU94_03620 [Geobacterales bacterium]|nr:hypothetical protein [Geobacterales bacterium]